MKQRANLADQSLSGINVMTKSTSYLILGSLWALSPRAYAQNLPPGYQDYMKSMYKEESASTEKSPRSPQANFFPGGRSSDNFFENKSVMPNLPGPDRKATYGTDQFHNPTEVVATNPIPEPEVNSEQTANTDSENEQDEKWSANKDQETEEVKNFNENIEKASEQISTEPKVQDVLAQSKRIREALFGKVEAATKKGESKSTVVSKNPEKVTKEIERF